MKLNIQWKKVLYGIALIVIGFVFNASGVKDVLLQLFNKIIGA